MLIRCGYHLGLTLPQETLLIGCLSPEPAIQPLIKTNRPLLIQPEIEPEFYIDHFGNECMRLLAPAGEFSMQHQFIIENDGNLDPCDTEAMEISTSDLPTDTLRYLLPSRYCDSDKLSHIAWEMFGQVAPGWTRVQTIMDFVHQHIKFDYQAADSSRTASMAFENKTGVCRDYAHLAIALCRALNIPARYVNGYMGDIGVPAGGPMDFNAWTEVYLGNKWYCFDPRNNQRRIGRVVVARGMDAIDIPLIHSFGPHTLREFKVWTEEVTTAIL